MINSTTNRINTLIQEADLALIKKNLEEINQIIPEIGLTPAERKAMRGASGVRRIFAEDCINVLKNNPEIVPDYINENDLIMDFELSKNLAVVTAMLKDTMSRVASVKRVADYEAYGKARIGYNLIAIASDSGFAGIKSAYANLKAHFAKNSGRKKSKLK